MSRAGRSSGSAAKRREVNERIAEAAAKHAAASGPPARAMPVEAERAFRAHQFFIRCHAAVVGRDRALWPAESIGAAIAEQWLQNIALRMQEAALADIERRATESGIVLPS